MRTTLAALPLALAMVRLRRLHQFSADVDAHDGRARRSQVDGRALAARRSEARRHRSATE